MKNKPSYRIKMNKMLVQKIRYVFKAMNLASVVS